jgi:phosphoribosylamine--glycine ligase
MKTLVIGGGGREHALVWKIAQSPRVGRVYCAPGNPGVARVPKAECVDARVGGDFSEIIRWAKAHDIGMTFVGPEIPLVEGIVDAFETAGLRIFGPNREAAQMEGSKIFCKDFMLAAGIPTAAARYFTDSAEALAYLKTRTAPYVIKAYGLAAGKGAIVAPTLEDAERAVRECLDGKVFGEAGSRILVEDFMRGEEASMLAFTDGRTVSLMPSAQDHKPVGKGDTGPNTGGMGAYSPAPVVTPALEDEIRETVLQRAVDALRERGIVYKGVLYAGLMIGEDGRPRVVEFNCRFGDPEAQPLLMRLETDLVDIAEAVLEERLDQLTVRWRRDPAVCVVMASEGYPGSYPKGREIRGLDEVAESESAVVFHAGTALKDERIVTAGGRVLGMTATAPRLEDAIRKAYQLCETVTFEGAFFRRDIGQKALRRVERG